MLHTIRHYRTRLKTIFRPFAGYKARRRAVKLFVALLTLLLLIAWLNVRNSYFNRDFMTSIERRDGSQFWSIGLAYAGVFLIIATITSFARYIEERLGLELREGLTRHLIDRYLADQTYHRLIQREDIDNPDQRVSEDVKTFTAGALSFTLIVLNSTIALVSFSGVLWSITPWLVIAAVLYAIVGTAGTVLLGRVLVQLNFLQLKKEADFRYRLMQIRENDEEIAMQGTEPWEGRRLGQRLRTVVDNFRQIVRVNLRLNIFVNSFNYLTQIIPVMVVAPLFFNGTMPFGAITQSVAAFAFVLNAFTIIVTQFQQITSLAAVAERLGSLFEAVEERPGVGPTVSMTTDGPRVAFEKLCVWTPEPRNPLITALNLELPPGRRLLVTGPDGAGKTALFKAVAGLWKWGDGVVVRPRPEDVMFLPPQAFLIPGLLRDQLCEGASCSEHPDARIQGVLRQLRLEKLVTRIGGLDANKDWRKVLSPSQQRLFAFARLLLAEPTFAFIDTDISGMNDFWIHTLYGALSKTRTTYVSIGDLHSLRGYHDVVLDLDGEGAWHLETCVVEDAPSERAKE